MTEATAPGVVVVPGAYDGMDDQRYHADPVAGGSLSVTAAKGLLAPGCPAKFAHDRAHRVFKAQYDFGHIAHQELVGAGAGVVVLPERIDSWRTDDAKSRAAAARLAGRTPMLAKEYAVVLDMVAALRDNPAAKVLLAKGCGVAERSMFWVDQPTGVTRRGRTDWQTVLADGRLAIVDYKTTTDASPDAISRAMHDHRYDMQADGYVSGATALGLGDDPLAMLVVQEKTPPYLASVVQVRDDALAEGHRANARALRLYAECSAADVWPGYGGSVADPYPIHVVGLPTWHKNEED